MTQTPVESTGFQPLYMKNINLILGDEATGTDFRCQLRSAVLTPDVNIVRIKTLCPDGQYANVDDPEWNLDLGYLYGRDATTPQRALGEYLRANAGTKAEFYFAPVAGEDGYSGTVTIVPGALGGEQGSFSEQSVSLPLDGQPIPWSA